MTVVRILEFTGVAVFAVSGALAAARRHLDLLGVLVIALVTATGGGTLRDVLLDRHPVFWIADVDYLYVILIAALGTIVWTRWWHPPDRALAYADALGLAMFTVSGAQVAEVLQLPAIVVLLMGTITGVAGGVLRDMLCAEIPMILRRGRFYATAAILGCCMYLLAEKLVNGTVAALAGMICIAVVRIAAIIWPLTLPVYTVPHERGSDTEER